MSALKTLGIGALVALAGIAIYLWGHSDGRSGKPPGLAEVSHAAPKEW